jgi:hypothetical protein
LHRFHRELPGFFGVARPPPIVYADIAIGVPAEVRKRFQENGNARLPSFVALCVRPKEYANARYALTLLRSRNKRPHGRSAKKRDERAPPHICSRFGYQHYRFNSF